MGKARQCERENEKMACAAHLQPLCCVEFIWTEHRPDLVIQHLGGRARQAAQAPIPQRFQEPGQGPAQGGGALGDLQRAERMDVDVRGSLLCSLQDPQVRGSCTQPRLSPASLQHPPSAHTCALDGIILGQAAFSSFLAIRNSTEGKRTESAVEGFVHTLPCCHRTYAPFIGCYKAVNSSQRASNGSAFEWNVGAYWTQIPRQGSWPVKEGLMPPCMQTSEAPRSQASAVRRETSSREIR